VRLRPRWKDQPRAQAVPAEFRRDVIAVARKGEASIAQIARDLGMRSDIEPSTVERLEAPGAGADRPRGPLLLSAGAR
jgi:transposase-like protein